MNKIALALFSSLILGLILIGIYSSPPQLDTLSVSELQVSSVTRYGNDKTVVKFVGSNKIELECVSNAKSRFKCPHNKLNESMIKKQNLMVWHDNQQIYQIKSNDEYLMKYDSWIEHSNFAFLLAGILLILLFIDFIRNKAK